MARRKLAFRRGRKKKDRNPAFSGTRLFRCQCPPLRIMSVASNPPHLRRRMQGFFFGLHPPKWNARNEVTSNPPTPMNSPPSLQTGSFAKIALLRNKISFLFNRTQVFIQPGQCFLDKFDTRRYMISFIKKILLMFSRRSKELKHRTLR